MRSTLVFLFCFCATNAFAQTYQFKLTVLDERERPLAGVTVLPTANATAGNGQVIVDRPEGGTYLTLSLAGYESQNLYVVTSRVTAANYAMVTLRKKVRTPPPVTTTTTTPVVEPKKITVTGRVISGENGVIMGVARATVKLFYDNNVKQYPADDNGEFTIAVEEKVFKNRQWKLGYSANGYKNSNEFVFETTDSTSSVVQLHLTLDPLPGVYHKKLTVIPGVDSQSVLDIHDGDCECLAVNLNVITVTFDDTFQRLNIMIKRDGFIDKPVILSKDELKAITESKLINMDREPLPASSRVNVGVYASLDLNNADMFNMSANWHANLIFHLDTKKMYNRWALVGGLSGKRALEVENEYQTLEGDVKSYTGTYSWYKTLYLGGRLYTKDYQNTRNVFFVQAGTYHTNQRATAEFSAENFRAINKNKHRYWTPELQLGYRGNIARFMSVEVTLDFMAVNLKSESFKFNYFGSADAIPVDKQIFCASAKGGLVFFIR